MLILCAVLSVSVAAQAPPTGTARGGPIAAPAPPIEVELSNMLQQIEQLAAEANADIGRLKVQRWKTDSTTKADAEAKIDSVQRNLTAALPGLIAAVRAAPREVAPSFRLYRNLVAVCDVLTSVAESTGAFGAKEQFEHLATDLNEMEAVRTNLGKRVEALAEMQSRELASLRQKARPPQTPSKVVIDDNAPAAKSKTTHKKPKPTQPPSEAQQ